MKSFNWKKLLNVIPLGEYELLIKIVLEDLDAYDKFRFEKLTRINGIAKINSSITIRELKNTTYIKL